MMTIPGNATVNSAPVIQRIQLKFDICFFSKMEKWIKARGSNEDEIFVYTGTSHLPWRKRKEAKLFEENIHLGYLRVQLSHLWEKNSFETS